MFGGGRGGSGGGPTPPQSGGSFLNPDWEGMERAATATERAIGNLTQALAPMGKAVKDMATAVRQARADYEPLTTSAERHLRAASQLEKHMDHVLDRSEKLERTVRNKLWMDYTKLNKEAERYEKTVAAAFAAHAKAGNNTRDFFAVAGPRIASAAQEAARLRGEMKQLETHLQGKKNLLGEFLGSIPGIGSVAHRLGDVANLPLTGPGAGGKTAFNMPNVASAAKAAFGIPTGLLAAKAVFEAGKEAFNAARGLRMMSKEFDLMVDRSLEVGTAMKAIVFSTGLSVRETEEYIGKLREAGLKADEVAGAAKDMVLTEKALGVPLDTQIRLYKLISREVRGLHMDLGKSRDQAQNLVRVTALIGQQLREFSVESALEQVEKMADRVKGLGADLSDMPKRMMLLYTSAGLATLGLSKARGMTQDMVKAVGDLALGMQDADFNTQIMSATLGSKGKSFNDALAEVGHLRAGRLLASPGTEGVNQQLLYALKPMQEMIERMVPESSRESIREGNPDELARKAVLVSEQMRGLNPGFAQIPANTMELLTEKLVDQVAHGKNLVEAGGMPIADSMKALEAELRAQGRGSEADALKKFESDLKPVNERIADRAKELVTLETMGVGFLRALVAKEVLGDKGLGPALGFKDTGEYRHALKAGATTPDDFSRYNKVLDTDFNQNLVHAMGEYDALRGKDHSLKASSHAALILGRKYGFNPYDPENMKRGPAATVALLARRATRKRINDAGFSKGIDTEEQRLGIGPNAARPEDTQFGPPVPSDLDARAGMPTPHQLATWIVQRNPKVPFARALTMGAEIARNATSPQDALETLAVMRQENPNFSFEPEATDPNRIRNRTTKTAGRGAMQVTATTFAGLAKNHPAEFAAEEKLEGHKLNILDPRANVFAGHLLLQELRSKGLKGNELFGAYNQGEGKRDNPDATLYGRNVVRTLQQMVSVLEKMQQRQGQQGASGPAASNEAAHQGQIAQGVGA